MSNAFRTKDPRACRVELKRLRHAYYGTYPHNVEQHAVVPVIREVWRSRAPAYDPFYRVMRASMPRAANRVIKEVHAQRDARRGTLSQSPTEFRVDEDADESASEVSR